MLQSILEFCMKVKKKCFFVLCKFINLIDKVQEQVTAEKRQQESGMKLTKKLVNKKIYPKLSSSA